MRHSKNISLPSNSSEFLTITRKPTPPSISQNFSTPTQARYHVPFGCSISSKSSIQNNRSKLSVNSSGTGYFSSHFRKSTESPNFEETQLMKQQQQQLENHKSDKKLLNISTFTDNNSLAQKKSTSGAQISNVQLIKEQLPSQMLHKFQNTPMFAISTSTQNNKQQPMKSDSTVSSFSFVDLQSPAQLVTSPSSNLGIKEQSLNEVKPTISVEEVNQTQKVCSSSPGQIKYQITLQEQINNNKQMLHACVSNQNNSIDNVQKHKIPEQRVSSISLIGKQSQYKQQTLESNNNANFPFQSKIQQSCQSPTNQINFKDDSPLNQKYYSNTQPDLLNTFQTKKSSHKQSIHKPVQVSAITSKVFSLTNHSTPPSLNKISSPRNINVSQQPSRSSSNHRQPLSSQLKSLNQIPQQISSPKSGKLDNLNIDSVSNCQINPFISPLISVQIKQNQSIQGNNPMKCFQSEKQSNLCELKQFCKQLQENIKQENENSFITSIEKVMGLMKQYDSNLEEVITCISSLFRHQENCLIAAKQQVNSLINEQSISQKVLQNLKEEHNKKESNQQADKNKLKKIISEMNSVIQLHQEREIQIRNLLIEFNRKGLIKIDTNGNAILTEATQKLLQQQNYLVVHNNDRKEYQSYKKNLNQLLLDQHGNNSLDGDADQSMVNESQESSFGFFGKISIVDSVDLLHNDYKTTQSILSSQFIPSQKLIKDSIRDKLQLDMKQVIVTQKLIQEQQELLDNSDLYQKKKIEDDQKNEMIHASKAAGMKHKKEHLNSLSPAKNMMQSGTVSSSTSTGASKGKYFSPNKLKIVGQQEIKSMLGGVEEHKNIRTQAKDVNFLNRIHGFDSPLLD